MEISTEMIKDNFNCREVLFAPKKIITDSSYDDNEEFGVILDGGKKRLTHRGKRVII